MLDRVLGPAPRRLAPGDVHVWYRLTDALRESDVDQALALLSSEERAQQSRFVLARDRRDYAAAHALLRESLSRYADVAPLTWRFRTDGKPSLDDESLPLAFNLSHTDGLVACAISDGRDVGIDVERIDRQLDGGVAERFFSETENAALRKCAPEGRRGRFIELWTLKEAYIKAIREGLAHPLNTIVFEFRGPESIVFEPPADVDGRTWQFALFAPTERYRLAVAARRERGRSVRIQVRSCDGTTRLFPIRASASPDVTHGAAPARGV
jgi:4'-phosphopantetheinyl transferase